MQCAINECARVRVLLAAVVLAPIDPDNTAVKMSRTLENCTILIVDINDVCAKILGRSAKIDEIKIISLLRQNPLG